MTTLACIYTTPGALGLIANVIQLILICRDKSQKNSVFGLSIFSLSIADLLASFTILLRGVVPIMAVCGVIDSRLLRELDHLTIVATIFSFCSSFTHLFFIAILRLIAVALPFKVKQIVSRRRCYFILALVWVASLALALSSYFSFEAVVVSACLTMLSGVMLVILYSVICYKTLKRNMHHNFSEEAQRRRRQSDRNVLWYSVAITAVFIVCNYSEVMRAFLEYPASMKILSAALFNLNPFLDTLLYFAWNYWKQRRQANVNQSPAVRNTPQGNNESAV